MATPFADTPTWFNTNYYLDQKVAQMQLADPKGEWTRDKVLSDFAAHNIDNPYDHYKAFGDIETLSPNPLFNNAEYLAAKAALMGSTWTVEMVAKDIAGHDLTLMEHYIKFGGKYENLSPSSEFNQDKYFDAKLDMMQTAEPDKGWTLEKVKADFAAAGISALEHYLTYGEVEGLNKYDYSVNGDPIPHPGNTKIVLTTGADVATKDATVAELKTTDRDDTISALVDSGTKSTLNEKDVIDGGAGVDTLKVDLQRDFTTGFKNGGSVKNVEKIELENAAGRSFNAEGIEKAQTYIVDGGDKGDTVIKNVDSADTSYVLTKEAGKFEVTIKDSALSGKADNVDVTLNGVGLDGAPVTLEVKGVSANGKLESLTLIADGKDNVVHVTAPETLVVEGAGNLTVATQASSMKVFDASAAKGNVNADLQLDTSTLRTVNGGAGDDTITIGAPAATAVFNGGENADKLVFNNLATGTVKNAISGFETITFKGDAGGGETVTFNVANVTGVDTIQYTGTATTDDDLSIVGASKWTEVSLAFDNKITSGSGSISYDGKGVLNLSMYGETGSDAEVASVTAAGVDTVNISNTSASKFTLQQLDARAATTMNVDTGDYGFVYADSSGGALGALKSVNLTGTGDANITFGANVKALTEINATELGGDLVLDLKDTTSIATGVTVTMGDYGATSLEGTTKADTFNLGAGAETVKLVAATATTYDTINDFDVSMDKIGGTITGTNAFVTAATKVALKISNINVWTVDIADATKLTTTDLPNMFTVVAGTAYVAVTDADDNVGIYKVVATGTSAYNTVALMGVLTDTDITTLDGVNFA